MTSYRDRIINHGLEKDRAATSFEDLAEIMTLYTTAIAKIPDPHYFAPEFGGLDLMCNCLNWWTSGVPTTPVKMGMHDFFSDLGIQAKQALQTAVIKRLQWLRGFESIRGPEWGHVFIVKNVVPSQQAGYIRIQHEPGGGDQQITPLAALHTGYDHLVTASAYLKIRIVLMGTHARTGVNSPLRRAWSQHLLFERNVWCLIHRLSAKSKPIVIP